MIEKEIKPSIINAAKQELYEEQRRREIDEMKEKLRNKKSFWDTIFPYKITIIKKEK